MSDRILVTVQPVAVTREVTARMLGIALSSFERYVQSDVRMIRRGKHRLVLVSEIHRWATENAERVLEGAA